MRFYLLFTLIILFTNCDQKATSETKTQNPIEEESITLELLAENLISPVGIENCGDDRLFILSQPGTISILKNGKISEKKFLDITDRVQTSVGYSEMGLLGLAFHPDYKSNGKFYIYYSAKSESRDSDHKSVISEFTVSSDPDSTSGKEKIIMEIEQPEPNHNGGQLAFGPDGFLYIGLGDGGGGGDQHGKIGNGQDLSTLLGKILRINTNTFPYSVPKDNPFINTSGAKQEIYAYGLRNPWRFSFDRKEGTLYCGDVGQNSYEEIDIIEKGKNYGWRAMEGNHVFDKSLENGKYEAPILEYGREDGVSVTGGYVYRGKNIPSLYGKYIFADWSGKFYILDVSSKNKNGVKPQGDAEFTINSFGEDSAGEIYIAAQKNMGGNNNTGMLYKLISK